MCFRHKTMWGWGGDKTETIENHEGKMYDATGIDVVTRIRFEHLTDKDKELEKAKGLFALGLYFKYASYIWNFRPKASVAVKNCKNRTCYYWALMGAGFPLGEFARANSSENKYSVMWLVSEKVFCQPITLLNFSFAQTNSPSGKPT